MSDSYFIKTPCPKCPFRKDVKPFLRSGRAEEIIYAPEFNCHQTYEFDEDGDPIINAESKVCAGFLTMQIREYEFEPMDGFVPSDLVYEDAFEMIQAYEQADREKIECVENTNRTLIRTSHSRK